MGSRRVQSPGGAEWLIRRRWVKWRPRWFRWWPSSKQLHDEDFSWSPVDLLDLLDELAIPLLFLAALVGSFVFFVLPALLFILQLLIFFALLNLTVLLRLVLRRPWIVEAVRVDGAKRTEWAVVGWWRSRRVIDEVAQGTSLGHRLIQPEGTRPWTEVAPKS